MTAPRSPAAPAHRREQPVLRIGDAERLATSLVLQDAAAQGRLTLAELDERLGAATAARTAPELAALVADLPAPQPSGGRSPLPRPAGAAVLLVLVTVLCVAASVRTGAPVLGPVGLVLLLLWRSSGGRRRRRRDLDSNR